MARLPDSLSIALWIIGSTWLLGLLALFFGLDTEVVWAAFLLGLFVGVYEWLTRRQDSGG